MRRWPSRIVAVARRGYRMYSQSVSFLLCLLCFAVPISAARAVSSEDRRDKQQQDSSSVSANLDDTCSSSIEHSRNQWHQIVQGDSLQVLQGERAHDLFGWSVSLSQDGTTLAVGAIDNDTNGSASGQVRLYKIHNNNDGHNNSKSVQVSPLGDPIDGLDPGDYHGYAVDLSEDGSIVAMGAPDHQQSAGMVRVYRYVNITATWMQLGESLLGDAPGDGFGHILALSNTGDVLVVGAPYYKQNTGLVRIFQFNHHDHSWNGLGQDLVGDTDGAQFGYSVAVSKDGNILVVGSKNHPYYYHKTARVGQVRTFQRIEGQWKPITKPLYGMHSRDYFGFALSLSASGAMLVVGNPYFDTFKGKDAGKVQVYQRVRHIAEVAEEDAEATCTRSQQSESYEWRKVGQDIPGEATNDYFGYSVSLSARGDTVAIGVRQGHELAGEVQVYDLIRSTDEGAPSVWTPVGEVIRGQYSKDQSGFSVSLPADGRMIAIGSPYHTVALSAGVENVGGEELGGDETAYSTKPNAGQVRIFWIEQ